RSRRAERKRLGGRMRVRRGVQFLALTLSMLLAGCASAPLPGGEGGGGYTVTIEFADVTDLVEYSSVKVDDVTVGEVSSVEVTDNWTAAVKVQINPDVALPRNTVARLRQTSLLGEKFV